MTIRVGIVGATGYTALEVARLLRGHAEATLAVATSRKEAGTPLAQIHPSLCGSTDVVIEPFDAESFASKVDVAMCCLPHGASAETVRELIHRDVRVVDFSADFRLSSLETYQQWYGVTHPWPERVGRTVYGMPEFYADEIRQADLVANPGCYPTSAILPLAPLADADLISLDDVIVDSKSGVSGAGRTPKVSTLYCETNESIAAYSVAAHRHQPEISDLVHRISGSEPTVIFTPHLAPMDRGILSTIYVKSASSADDVMACWQKSYAKSPFVHPIESLPATKHVSGTNQVHMAVRSAGDRLILVCAIDNLVKGASGAAIQNMNVMFGLDETMGLA
ncbi:MAG: N-acetyl-gamma-glutamyl-phosphate reductase [Planctomycetota bacterium]